MNGDRMDLNPVRPRISDDDDGEETGIGCEECNGELRGIENEGTKRTSKVEG